MQDYRRLVVWQKAHRFVQRLYSATAQFPVEERYGLTSQLRRAAVSVPSNLAEACGRGGSKRDMLQFIRISSGSIAECDYQLLLAHDLGYLSDDRYAALNEAATEIAKMLHGLRRAVAKN